MIIGAHSLEDITPALARRSGFSGVVDLLIILSTVAAKTSISLSFTTNRSETYAIALIGTVQ